MDVEKNKVREFLLTFVGILYVALGVFSYYAGIKDVGLSGIFWFSYTAFFLIGIGTLTRSSFIIASQVNIVLLPYLIWTADFLYVLITGTRLFGITDYIFWQGPIVPKLITLQHLFTIPFSFLALYAIKLKRKDSWKFSVVQVVAFFIIVKLLTFPGKNVNCVFDNCLPFNLPFLPYSVMWFLFYGVMIFLSALLINWLFFRKDENGFKEKTVVDSNKPINGDAIFVTDITTSRAVAVNNPSL